MWNFLKFLFSFWGCGRKVIQQIQKNIHLKKFLKTLNLFFQPELPGKKVIPNNIYPSSNITGPSNFDKALYFSGNSSRENKLRVFKNLLAGYLFVFVQYLCNRSPIMRRKYFKNYISILIIVNYRNWLDALALFSIINY